MAARVEQSVEPEVDEARREALRRDPTVVVHRRSSTEPFKSAIRVVRTVDPRELIGRCDADEADEAPCPRG